jgi:alanyl-tRNA synthetase
MRNHSATHLLHEALRQVLGDHIKQAGSLVAPDYLRFDFNHFEKVSSGDLSRIEAIVNEMILESKKVGTEIMKLDEISKNSKVRMFFGDKYGDVVRVVTMDPKFSIELCGGTHVSNTSEIGLFKIVSESSIAAGVRRIEAVTGRGVREFINSLEKKIEDKNTEAESMLDRVKKLEKEINSMKSGNLRSDFEKLVAEATLVNGIKVLTSEIVINDMDQLRTAGENLRNIMGANGIGLLAAQADGKVQLLCCVTDDLKDRFPAGKLVGMAAKVIGGNGGGKPHLATAGGKDIDKLPELLKEFQNLIFTV